MLLAVSEIPALTEDTVIWGLIVLFAVLLFWFRVK